MLTYKAFLKTSSILIPFRRSHKSCTDPSPTIYPHTRAKPPANFDATKFRQWIDVSHDKEKKNEFSVMTFNLLSRHYVWRKVFGDLVQDYLDWPHYRFPLINATIAQFNCDIMCFQELEALVYENQWKHNFPLKDYHLLYVRKPKPKYWGSKPTEFMDGVGVFVNSNRFDLLDHVLINYGLYVSEHPNRFDFTEDVKTRVFPRNTVGLILKLWDKKARNLVYVANTHLYWLPKFNDVKLFQTKILLNELARFTRKDREPNPCVIICGDFNSTPQLLVYELLKEGEIVIDGTEEFEGLDYGNKFDGELLDSHLVRSPFNLTAAYGSLLDKELINKLDFTSYSKDFVAVLDHIWFSSANLQVNRVLGKVEQTYCANSAGFPDSQFPSDHIPLVSEISYL